MILSDERILIGKPNKTTLIGVIAVATLTPIAAALMLVNGSAILAALVLLGGLSFLLSCDFPLCLTKPLSQAELDQYLGEVANEIRQHTIAEHADKIANGGILVMTIDRSDLRWRANPTGAIKTPHDPRWIGVTPQVRAALSARVSRRKLAATSLWTTSLKYSCPIAPPSAHDIIASRRSAN